MNKYIRTEEKPLSELIGSRKAHYLKKVEKAFDAVYNSARFGYIEQFEKIVSELSEKAVQGRLEGIVVEQEEKSIERKLKEKPIRKVDKRQRLTSYQYAKSRDAGLTNEQIKEKFRIDSYRQLGGFVRQYNRKNLQNQ